MSDEDIKRLSEALKPLIDTCMEIWNAFKKLVDDYIKAASGPEKALKLWDELNKIEDRKCESRKKWEYKSSASKPVKAYRPKPMYYARSRC